MDEIINTDALLPVGERLKPLLSKSCISESYMKTMLAERGVYIGNSNKKSSIPILTLSILSPREFEKLQEFQKTKEDSLKAKVMEVKSLSDNNLNDLVPQDLIKREELLDEYDCFDFDTDLSFDIDNQNKLKDSISIGASKRYSLSLLPRQLKLYCGILPDAFAL